MCGLLDPAARGPVPGLVALTFGLGYRGGLCSLQRVAEKRGKLYGGMQLSDKFHPHAFGGAPQHGSCRAAEFRLQKTGGEHTLPASRHQRSPKIRPVTHPRCYQKVFLLILFFVHKEKNAYRYIRSGASTPSSASPFFSTLRAASASLRRALSTFSASPLMRQAV